MPTDVVITGIGIITPLGHHRESSWKNIQAGKTATRFLDELEDEIQTLDPKFTDRFGRIIGAPACPRPPENKNDSTTPKVITSEPIIDLAMRAATEAIADAQLKITTKNQTTIGCVIGTSKGGLLSFKNAFTATQAAAQKKTNRKTNNETKIKNNIANQWKQFFPNQPALTVAQQFNLQGPCLCPVAACATGLTSIQRGYELIRDGYCNTVIAGSTDASLRPEIIASYRRLGVLANSNDINKNNNPATACKPFDVNRSGFVIGEGAAIVVLEKREQAEARNAKIYAQWLAGGTASEAHSIAELAPQPHVLTRLIQDVLRQANVTSNEIDYCNLHGTATRPNDIYETTAIKQSLGQAAKTVACSSIKGGIGHLLGAAGSVEIAITLLAMRDGIIPPTVNHTIPDPQCDLNYTPQQPLRKPIETALKLSLGFGGHLTAAIIRAT